MSHNTQNRVFTSTHRSLRLVSFVAALVATTGLAAAYMTAGSVPGSNAVAQAVGLSDGEPPYATVANGNRVTLQWDPSYLAYDSDYVWAPAYKVVRYDLQGVAQPTNCTWTGTTRVPSCVETAVPDGSWKYGVTPLAGDHWSGGEALGWPVTVETTPPVNTVTLANATGNVVLNSATKQLFYKSSVGGSFQLSNALTDTGSGPASSTTSALSGTTTGWSHTPSTVTTPVGGPYVSNAFTFAAGAASSPSVTITGRDNAGNIAPTTFSISKDESGPSGGFVNGSGLRGAGGVYTTFGPYLSLSKGTDSGAGLATSGNILERASGTLISSDGVANGVCGALGAYTLVKTDPGGSYGDSAPGAGCYSYRYTVKDKLGNATTYTSPTIKYDPSPVAPSTYSFSATNHAYGVDGLGGAAKVYVNSATGGSFTITSGARDSESGISAVTFDDVAGWTRTDISLGVATYSWPAGAAAPAGIGAMLKNNADQQTWPGSATVIDDTTPPPPVVMDYPNVTQTTTSVTLTGSTPADTGSGLQGWLLQRAQAPMNGDVCSAQWGTYTDVGTNLSSPYVDSTLQKGFCYKYRVYDYDNVGNWNATIGTNVVSVVGTYYDTIMNSGSLMDYWRLNQVRSASDTFNIAPSGSLLSTHTAELGGKWVLGPASPATALINLDFTNNGWVSKYGSTTRAQYYSPAAPSSADYTVEADIRCSSILTFDAIGVTGRQDVSSGSQTYYAGMYDRTLGGWAIFRVVNGIKSQLGSTAAGSLDVGNVAHISLDMHGSSIKLYVDGVEKVAATDGALTAAGYAGVVFGNGAQASSDGLNAGVQLDNFAMTGGAADSTGPNPGVYFGLPGLGVTGAIAGDFAVSFANTAARDYVSMPDNVNGDFSIEFWMQGNTGLGSSATTSWTTGAGLVDADISGLKQDFGVSLSADGKILFGLGNGATDTTLASTTAVPSTGWHQIVVTRDSATGTMSIYIDGAAAGSMVGPTNTMASPTLNLGRLASGSNYYNGAIDDVSVWSSTLAASTVASHYHSAGY